MPTEREFPYEPDAGNLHVRFPRGVRGDGHWPRPFNPSSSPTRLPLRLEPIWQQPNQPRNYLHKNIENPNHPR
jgi:hypothetical protein